MAALTLFFVFICGLFAGAAIIVVWALFLMAVTSEKVEKEKDDGF